MANHPLLGHTPRAKYPLLIKDVYQGKINLEDGKKLLDTILIKANLNEKERKVINAEAFRDFAQQVLADDILTEAEEKQLLGTAEALGIENTEITSDFKDILFRLLVAQANDGRLPIIPNPNIALKKDEQVHLEMQSALLKEVAIKEYQGGYSGVSFRIAKGVRFHTGGARGRIVVVGHQLTQSDRGRLLVTSQRAIFLGQNTSIEMPFNKILSLELFENGVRFHLSNRKKAPLFQVPSGDVVTAIVNSAMKRLLEV
jgi:hypothetical protein